MRCSLYNAFFALILLGSIFLPQQVFADTLLISPSAGSYSVGQTFAVRIMVSSASQAVNAVSAVLSFPADKLQVTSVSKIGSILNLWVEEPSFSNSQGRVSLEGVVPNPGFTGSNGPVLTITFRVLATGTANLQYSSGSLLANDGYGTNILKNRGTASLTLSAAPASEPKEEFPEEAGTLIDLNEPKPAPNAEAPKETTVSFHLPSFASVASFMMKFLSVVIPLVALIFFLIHTTKRGVGNMRSLRGHIRKDLHSIDRLVEKSFDIFKEDITDIIHILERARTKRKLTAEEDAIIHRLRQNLVDAEKIIQAEINHAEKDLGD